MKATLILDDRNLFQTESGKRVVISMDLFLIEDPKAAKHFPEGYKFSWIAFLEEDPDVRVLFDCHYPKGPHFHIDDDREGIPFEWKDLPSAKAFFLEKVSFKFGRLTLISKGLKK